MSLNGYKKKYKPALWVAHTGLEGVNPIDHSLNKWNERKKIWMKSRLKQLRPAIRPKTVKASSASRQTRIRPRSKSMTAKMRQYNLKKAEFLKAFPLCAVHLESHQHPATEIHHSRGRAGKLLLDERFWFGVCSAAHEWIHNQPAAACRHGFLCQSGGWNTPPSP